MNPSVPNQNVVLPHHEIVGLHTLGHLENARFFGRPFRIETNDALVELVEQEQVAIRADGQSLRPGKLDVFAGVRNADRIGRIAAGKPLDDHILGCGSTRQKRGQCGSECNRRQPVPRQQHRRLVKLNEKSGEFYIAAEAKSAADQSQSRILRSDGPRRPFP